MLSARSPTCLASMRVLIISLAGSNLPLWLTQKALKPLMPFPDEQNRSRAILKDPTPVTM